MTDFRTLSIPERLELIEEIWNSIADDAHGIVLTDAQKQQLEQRLDAFYLNPPPGQPVSAAIEDLQKLL